MFTFIFEHNVIVIGAALSLAFIYFSGVIRFISNSKIGVIEKIFSFNGSVENGFIALNGEAGFQPDVLRGGWHFMKPFMYRIHIMPLVTIPQGTIGYVFARDGETLKADQTLASNIKANDFQNVRKFLECGGQKGPQRKILREGTYAINLAQFIVFTTDTVYYLDLDAGESDLFQQTAGTIEERGGFHPVIIRGKDDSIGIVTIHDGHALPQGEIIAPVVGSDPKNFATYHNSFQDPESFIAAGGFRGRQYQVLVDGTYYINRLFATVEMIPKTTIPVGHVGVVVSFTGETGADLSGAGYKHGELVKKGQRGVWDEPLLPGKYAFNIFAGSISLVPTTNFILNWKKSEVGEHKYDENLQEVSLITKDAFEPTLPLSVVVHIDYKKAPLVIQRFGNIKILVEQTLDPMISAYFKNTAQTKTLIQLLQDRAEIQTTAGVHMRDRFEHYNLELEEVLIGTPGAGTGNQIEQILTQLRSRQIAEEQVETYNRQEKAAVKERELKEAEAKSRQQSTLTESEISIQIQSNQGKAEYQRALQQAAQIRTMAEAESEKVTRIGIANAIATEEQVRAYGGPQFQVMQQAIMRLAESIEKSGVDIVPKVVVGGGGNYSAKDGEKGSFSGSNNIIEGLLSMLLTERVGLNINTQSTPRNAQADEIRAQIKEGIANNK